MTTAHAPTGRRYRFSLCRVFLCGVLLSLLVAACLYVYHTAFEFYHARLLENDMKTIAWFVRQVGLSLPFIVICLFHYMVYHKHDRRDGQARREMLWEIILVAVLTYGVLLPYLAGVSQEMYDSALAAGAIIPDTEGGVPETLLMSFHEWFIRLTVPLCLLGLFHAVRAEREICEAREAASATEVPAAVEAGEPEEAEAKVPEGTEVAPEHTDSEGEDAS